MNSLGLSGVLKIKYVVSVADLPQRHTQCQHGSREFSDW